MTHAKRHLVGTRNPGDWPAAPQVQPGLPTREPALTLRQAGRAEGLLRGRLLVKLAHVLLQRVLRGRKPVWRQERREGNPESGGFFSLPVGPAGHLGECDSRFPRLKRAAGRRFLHLQTRLRCYLHTSRITPFTLKLRRRSSMKRRSEHRDTQPAEPFGGGASDDRPLSCECLPTD